MAERDRAAMQGRTLLEFCSYNRVMAEIPDFRLNHPDVPPDSSGDYSLRDSLGTGPSGGDFTDSPSRTKWIILVVLFLIGATTIGYSVYRRTRPQAPEKAVAQPPPAVTVPARPRTGPLVEADNIPLPRLQEMDVVVRTLVVKLSSHPKVLAWLATNGLIENFTVATLNLSEGRTPVRHWTALKPKERFSVTKGPGGTRLDPKSYRRYDDFAAAIAGLDPAGTARLYLTLKPRIMDAYRDLGYPEGDFDPVLERAISTLLRTKELTGEIALEKEILTYGFADPDLQALLPAQKQLLRMGPENMRIVQNRLREIAVQLDLHPESVRPSGPIQ
jgi:hypothetical protein